MANLLLVWLLNAVALLGVSYLLSSGIHIDGFKSALWAALILGLVNTMIRPVFALLTLPITIVTLGLFLFVINGLMFWLVGSILTGFRVDGFWWAVAGAILYSVMTGFLTNLIASV
jgi:putative membrane protein